MAKETKLVDFNFHEPFDRERDGTLDIEQTVSVTRGHFRFSLTARNFTGKPIPNRLIVVFFANGCNQTPSKSVVLTRANNKSPWNTPVEYPLNSEEGCSEVFRNVFLVPTRNNGTCLLLFRDEHAYVFNEQMEKVSMVKY